MKKIVSVLMKLQMAKWQMANGDYGDELTDDEVLSKWTRTENSAISDHEDELSDNIQSKEVIKTVRISRAE